MIDVAVLLGVLSQTAPWPTEAAIIERAKKAIVRDIDGALPQVTLEAWLRDVLGPRAAMAWEVNDCGEHPGNASRPGRDYPVCVEVKAGVAGDRQLVLFFQVGSQTRLTTGPPALRFGTLGESAPRAGSTSISKLAQIPTLLAR